VSNETPGIPSKWTVHFELSRDLGTTWERTSPVNDGIAIQAIQPSILFMGDGKLLAIGRSRQDRVFQVSSDDGGKSWGRMTLGTLPNNNSGDRRRHANGRNPPHRLQSCRRHAQRMGRQAHTPKYRHLA